MASERLGLALAAALLLGCTLEPVEIGALDPSVDAGDDDPTVGEAGYEWTLAELEAGVVEELWLDGIAAVFVTEASGERRHVEVRVTAIAPELLGVGLVVELEDSLGVVRETVDAPTSSLVLTAELEPGWTLRLNPPASMRFELAATYVDG